MLSNKYRHLITISILCGALAGCASSGPLSPDDVKTLGHVKIVYIAQKTNLIATDGGQGGDIMKYYLAQDAQYLDQLKPQVDALQFNDASLKMLADMEQKTPWLQGAPISQIQDTGERDLEKTIVLQSDTDSVIIVRPVFAIGVVNNQLFSVDFVVTVAQKNPKKANGITTVARKEFEFLHRFTLVTPGMPWEKQKELAHALAGMSMKQSMDAWFDNGASKIKGYFATDMGTIESELPAFLGS